MLSQTLCTVVEVFSELVFIASRCSLIRLRSVTYSCILGNSSDLKSSYISSFVPLQSIDSF